MCHTWIDGSHLENLVTLGKMGFICKSGSHFQKMGHTLKSWWHVWKNRSPLENRSHFLKWVKFENMGHIWRIWIRLKKRTGLGKWVKPGWNGSHLEKRVTLEKISHTWKNRSYHMQKMGHGWKNESHLRKWATLGRVRNWARGRFFCASGFQFLRGLTSFLTHKTSVPVGTSEFTKLKIVTSFILKIHMNKK